MGRILAIDYGSKRTGLAVTDPLQIIANRLETVPTNKLFEYLTDYLQQEEVERIVVGEPLYPDGAPAQLMPQVIGFVRKLRKLFPELPVVFQDERYTSETAKEVIRQSGAKRKKRQDKGLVDQVAAVLILQDYLEENKYGKQ